MQLKFTKKAEDVINYAGKSASELGHNYIGTEHLLLGLVYVKNSVAAKALEMKNVTYDNVKEELINLVGQSNTKGYISSDAFTPRMKRILNRSCDEAVGMGTNYIGTEHMLIAIIKESSALYGDSIAIKILQNLNVNPQALYDDILVMLGEGENSTGTPINRSSKNSNRNNNTPTLDQYSRDFTNLAMEHKFDPIDGRDTEIERVIQILSRRTKNNPCLVGEPGVGKTAIAEGLAEKIVKGDVPEILKGKRVVSLDISSVVAGSKYRGEFEERIKKIIKEVKESNNVILFIDEIHTIIGAGGAEGAIDASNILKPSLARGEIQIIGATTLNEYRKHIEKDAALERRFQPVKVEEPTEEDAIKMLKCLRDKYEVHHSVKITDDAIISAVKLSNRYITDRFLPDKAIDVLDEAASKVRLTTFTMPPDIKNLEEQLEQLSKEKEEAIKTENYERASQIKVKEQEIRTKLDEEKNNWKDKNGNEAQVVTPEEIADIISGWTGIPVKKMQEEESQRLKNMESILHERVIGQEDAVKSVAKAIRRGRIGLKNPKRPIGSFLFLGPTGVGKTELSKTLSEVLFGDEDSMIRVDMSEFMEKHSVSKLIGSPPGYVGYDDGGQISEKIRRKPYSVILFDEIEKAHPDVFNLLLQVLDDGHITDSQGRKIDFKNTVIIMTSNVGARSITENKKLGFTASDDEVKKYEDMKKSVMEQVKKTFKPEFLNRIDDIIVFHTLSKDEVKEISKIMLDELSKRIKDNLNIEISFTEKAMDKIVELGYDNSYGARPLRRAIQTNIEDNFAEKYLDEAFSSGDNITVDYTEEFTFNK
ncbi:ATP-dependent Clp protease ATP-binding subunit [uncultured Tyzzerella sp.]|uniref:ATP-dependent Clp protease ATP-binding subunit n=1 Tax=uncultured Tyzzerella sp. TaxID=2321398 RepID=UPI0029423F70|nr:ATP-dependent Clp protease ATP-binding subunit [uncultured Tyzzerella sp.]